MHPPDLSLFPHVLARPDALFDWLSSSVVWDERMRARKTASFGVAYNYSNISYPHIAMPPLLAALCDQLEAMLAFRPNNCLINFYPDGDATMGFHSDETAFLAPGTGVAIVSLGYTRTIRFRSKSDRAANFDYALTPGSLLYMPAAMQADWLHAIPASAGAGGRISLTFRAICKT